MDDVANQLERLVERDREHDCAGFGQQKVCVRIVAVAELPTRFGDFLEPAAGFRSCRFIAVLPVLP